MSKDVSIIIPVVRPEKAKRCIEAIINGTLEITSYGNRWPIYEIAGSKVEIIACEDVERIGCPKMLDKLEKQSTGDLVCFLGDDTIPKFGWLQAALKAMEILPDGWGVVGLNSQQSRHAAHFLADKRMLDLLPDGQFFNTAYHHCFCDNELTDIAKEHGRFIFCDESLVEHDHPIFTGKPEDEDYQRVYKKDVWQHDRSLYYQRKRDRLKGGIAIGFPLVDKTVPATFFLSFATMEKPERYVLLAPTDPHGCFPTSISAARNSIVEQAMNAGCSWLLMMDTDQVYPPDTLMKLYAHQKDVCGVLVHRGWPPFDPIFLRGEPNKYIHVPEEECFSGGLIEIDATGTGCLLINMTVFDELAQPYFNESVIDGHPIGEDINFCWKVRQLGKKIYADTSIKVGHLRQVCIDRLFYEVHKKLNS